jgi:hypothetical protein
MKPALSLLLILFVPFYPDAQSVSMHKDTAKQDYEVLQCRRQIDLPVFAGGYQAWMHYIKSHIGYISPTNQSANIITVQFIVSKQGIVTEAIVLGSVRKDFTNEIIRVINASPTWTPARQNGRPVSWRIVQQITLGKEAISVQPCENSPNRFIPIS